MVNLASNLIAMRGSGQSTNESIPFSLRTSTANDVGLPLVALDDLRLLQVWAVLECSKSRLGVVDSFVTRFAAGPLWTSIPAGIPIGPGVGGGRCGVSI